MQKLQREEERSGTPPVAAVLESEDAGDASPLPPFGAVHSPFVSSSSSQPDDVHSSTSGGVSPTSSEGKSSSESGGKSPVSWGGSCGAASSPFGGKESPLFSEAQNSRSGDETSPFSVRQSVGSPFSAGGQAPPFGSTFGASLSSSQSTPFGESQSSSSGSPFGGPSSFGGQSSLFGTNQASLFGDNQPSPFGDSQPSPFFGQAPSCGSDGTPSAEASFSPNPFGDRSGSFDDCVTTLGSGGGAYNREKGAKPTVGLRVRSSRKNEGRTPKYLIQQREAESALERDAWQWLEEVRQNEMKRLKEAKQREVEEKEVQMGQLQRLLLTLRSFQRESEYGNTDQKESEVTCAFNWREGSGHSVEDMLATIREVVDIATEEEVVFPQDVGSALLTYCIVYGNNSEHGDLLTALLEAVPFDSISSSGHQGMYSYSRVSPVTDTVRQLLFPEEDMQRSPRRELETGSKWEVKCSPLYEALRNSDRLWAYSRIVERVGASSPLMASLHTRTPENFESFRHGPLLYAAAFHGSVAPVLQQTPGLLYHTLLDDIYLLQLAAPDSLIFMWNTVISTCERVLATDPSEFDIDASEAMTALSQRALLSILEYCATLACNHLCDNPRHTVSYAAEAEFERSDPFASLKEMLMSLPDWLTPGLQIESLPQKIVRSAVEYGCAEVTLLLLSFDEFSVPCLTESTRLSLLKAAFDKRNLELAKVILRRGHPLDLLRRNCDRGIALGEAMKTDAQWTAEVVTGMSEEFPLTEKELEEVRQARTLFWKAIYELVWTEEQEESIRRSDIFNDVADEVGEACLVRDSHLNGMRLLFDVMSTLGLDEYDSSFFQGLLRQTPTVHVANVLTEKIPAKVFLDVEICLSKRMTVFTYFVVGRPNFAFGLAEAVPEMLEGLTRDTWDECQRGIAPDISCLLRLLPHMPAEELIKPTHQGCNALHQVAAYCTSVDLIEQLRMALPPSAASMTDNQGRTPLDIFLQRELSEHRLPAMAAKACRLKKILAPSTTAKRAI